MKQCSQCKVCKPLNEFSVRKDRPSGYRSNCKQCENYRCRKWRRSDSGQKTQKKYRESDAGILSQKLGQERHKQTERRQEYCKQYNKRYRESEHGKLMYRYHARKRHERKLGLDGGFTVQNELTVRERFFGRCFNCDASDNLTIDHHYPLSKGYGLSLSNAVLLCQLCNSRKRDKMPEDFYTPEQLELLQCLVDFR